MRFYYSLFCFFLSFNCLKAQDDPWLFAGRVVSELDSPLVGAVVYWTGTTTGATTDLDGWFTIRRLDTTQAHTLTIQYIGYADAEVEIFPEEERLRLVLESGLELDGVTVDAQQRAAFRSTLDPLNVEQLGQGELGRAACCNLGESFENTATVNIMYTDAVTGAKELEMLGLRGTYTQMLLENRPMFNRLGQMFGLDHIPGTFIQNIQLSKGASSVKNGSQSIAGQINTNLLKPFEAPLFFVNLYANNFGRFELNTQFNYRFSQAWSVGLLLHGSTLDFYRDDNGDNFADIPQKRQLNGIARIFFQPKNWHIECNFQGILDDKKGGQIEPSETPTGPRLYTVNNLVRRLGTFGKMGFLGFKQSDQSIALIYDVHTHQHEGVFGPRNYGGNQQRVYLNTVFQTNLWDPNHQLSAGLTYEWVQLQERFAQAAIGRQEQWRSAYAQYSYTLPFNNDWNSSLTILAGMRADWLVYDRENQVYPVPRLNVKLGITDDLVLRGSVGRGVRLPVVLAENMRFLVSDREINLPEDNQSLTEDATNFGLNAVWNYHVNNNYQGNWSVDAYRTVFHRQILSDVCSDPNGETLDLVPLEGASYSNSLLVAFTQYFFQEQWELRLAYKYTDAQATMGGILQPMPFQPIHRGLVHLAWKTPKKNWSANVTLNIIGSQRLPPMSYRSDVPNFYLTGYSPTFAILNAHVVKYFGKQWEIYIGGENLTNYLQPQPVLGAAAPFAPSSFFDASMAYGPTATRRIYIGAKYRLQGKQRFAAPSCEG